MANFLVSDTFEIANTGFGLIGRVTLGVINNGDIAVIKKELDSIQLRIISVEQVENATEGDNWRALLLSDADKQRIEAIDLTGVTIFVYEPSVDAATSEGGFWETVGEIDVADSIGDAISGIFDGD